MSTRPDTRTAVIFSASSDIGAAMALRWREAGWAVRGTYRTASAKVAELRAAGVDLVACDFSNVASLNEACKALAAGGAWDVLAILPATMEPIGPFGEVDIDAWCATVTENFLNEMRVVHALLPSAAKAGKPLVLFFAGGGSNGAPVNYSAYTISKIALIKMCELLDAENPGLRFAILGPGWVKTKIHEETLRAGTLAGDGVQKTRERFESDAFTAMDDVLDCCDWLASAPGEAISGRNFSVVHDAWRDPELERALSSNPDMYKLRRSGNGWTAKPEGSLGL
jgi:NAD(P)-dependent dehydrogenase (short-subunit alcohol dehydrogenase family)